jgi:hypothetical protein
MPVGKLLLLDTQCEAFKTLVKPSQMTHVSKKRKRQVVTYDSLGVPVPVSLSPSAVSGKNFACLSHPNLSRNGARNLTENRRKTIGADGSRFIQVRLDVPRNYTPVHGKLYVSIHARYEVSRCTEDIRSIYVNPEDLIIPTAQQAEEALHCFYI